MLYSSVIVESIKLAVCNLHDAGFPARDILMESISWLRRYFEMTDQDIYLKEAVCHIYAYLELGYLYEEAEQEIQTILKYLGKSREEVFPGSKWGCKKVALNKTSIRNLLGRWNPKLHSMKIEAAVSDIYEKIQEQKDGEYLYHCGKEICRDGQKILWEQMYWLYIRDGEATFYDARRNRYYIFE